MEVKKIFGKRLFYKFETICSEIRIVIFFNNKIEII
jgi:hypothetical protein